MSREGTDLQSGTNTKWNRNHSERFKEPEYRKSSQSRFAFVLSRRLAFL